jgi:DnaJ like chaperone protein
MFHNNPVLLEQILGGLFIIAAADNAGLSPAEINFLERVGVIFGFDHDNFARVAARAGVHLPGAGAGNGESASSSFVYEEDHYTILGVSRDASFETIKSAYRALIREHHPDRLVAQGMPPEFVAAATEKMKRINGAYDAICKAKGMK